MEDAVRPNEQEFKAMYERGYCTWFSLYEMTIVDAKTGLPWWDCLFQLENEFLNHPSFPGNVTVDASFSNTVIATEKGVGILLLKAIEATSSTHPGIQSFTEYRPLPAQYRAASFATALSYLSSYCEFYQVAEQSHAALAATLLLPVARFDNRTVQLPTPRVRRKGRFNKETIYKIPVWSENLNQLDRLLTLSCNAVGTKALLTSVFFEPGVGCNICGAWLQGTFAFLDSDIVQDQNILLRVLIKRDPGLGFLWLGAFIIGAQKRSLQEARQAWWKIDLHVAAWTGTLMSFIQEPVSTLPRGIEEISRADECRLMYLSHDQYYTVPPLFPFAPFGSTAMTDTNIDVRQHARCETSHGLEYESVTWHCRGGQRSTTTVPRIPLRAKNGQATKGNISINYDNFDNEDDDCSEMVTRNIFTWLRDDDGFPVAERVIREHEWIDNLDSDDDCPITGDAQSTVGGNLHGWLLKTMTRRSNSL
ncbi:Uncharacterized protein BP5553_04491 [Venustampulla echinocandica]|uniref:Uncharacterized protein n=1 Tax=Venustampulla echinocandica TaxID=2656787 RepID=A0A370TNG7_9HELO|nr:Uncharacterized protein BP5553_04491 [Venustampulla echinocandica]RDL37058.1 Uncharacterized protein BP5553_04491 [Venustampulla echinocandica]